MLLKIYLNSQSGFNPRSREGSDDEYKLTRLQVEVSIHAPVKGATYSKQLANYKKDVSIHAPVKGATRKCTNVSLRSQVSIHAPVKGATEIKTLGMCLAAVFQSTLP